MTPTLAEVTRILASGGFPPQCEAPGHEHPATVWLDGTYLCARAALEAKP